MADNSSIQALKSNNKHFEKSNKRDEIDKELLLSILLEKQEEKIDDKI